MLRSFRFVSSSAALVAALAGTAGSQMASHGPINAFGFPESYTDFDGTTVVMGTDVNDPFGIVTVLDLPDPNAPLSVASGNFFEEGFYWLGSADIDTAAGAASLIMAEEFAFLNGPVAQGDQVVFARLRLRIDVSTAGHYKVTHPYGVDEFDVAVPGVKAINFTDDSIAALGATAFDTPLGAAARIGPTLLGWDAGAPPGYLGNPNVPHTVTGSPFGTNFFRVEGPNIGGPGVNSIQTTFFSIAGKLGAAPPVSHFTNLGSGKPGVGGVTPLLTGTGDLLAGTPFTIDLTQALGSAPALYFVSPTSGATPFLGGILIPNPATGERRNTLTNALGEVHAHGTFPNVPSGTSFFMQFFVLDPAGTQGASASNALQAIVP